ncbi:helix-turn-helix domain-containing protein [Catellatospora sp. NPDC049609]|uniref:helix-turn-helix domain-containing protein n=1 Tax=Catellatospora sp. NPDC049609 TaxID=3155505 RepID=UPI00343E2783
MRYADGGGVDQAGRERREQVRGRAGQMFADGMSAPEVAAVLEVSTKAAYTWRRAWVAGGVEALASNGPPGRARRLSADQVQRLAARLDEGPAAADYDGQRWTWPGSRS